MTPNWVSKPSAVRPNGVAMTPALAITRSNGWAAAISASAQPRTLPNEASVALHEACGFELVGVYRRIGFKAGAWRDVGWWQLELGSATDDPPAELGPPARL